MVQIKWLGNVPTKVRTEENGSKVEVKPGAVFECDDKMAKLYSNYKKEFAVVTQDVRPATIEKAKVETEGEVKKAKKGKK